MAEVKIRKTGRIILFYVYLEWASFLSRAVWSHTTQSFSCAAGIKSLAITH